MTKEQFEEMLDLVIDDPVVMASAFKRLMPVAIKFINELVAHYKETTTKYLKGLFSDEIKKIIRDINPFK